MCVQKNDKNQWCYARRYKNHVFPMMLQNMASVWGDNFVNNHPNYIFSEFA